MAASVGLTFDFGRIYDEYTEIERMYDGVMPPPTLSPFHALMQTYIPIFKHDCFPDGKVHKLNMLRHMISHYISYKVGRVLVPNLPEETAHDYDTYAENFMTTIKELLTSLTHEDIAALNVVAPGAENYNNMSALELNMVGGAKKYTFKQYGQKTKVALASRKVVKQVEKAQLKHTLKYESETQLRNHMAQLAQQLMEKHIHTKSIHTPASIDMDTIGNDIEHIFPEKKVKFKQNGIFVHRARFSARNLFLLLFTALMTVVSSTNTTVVVNIGGSKGADIGTAVAASGAGPFTGLVAPKVSGPEVAKHLSVVIPSQYWPKNMSLVNIHKKPSFMNYMVGPSDPHKGITFVTPQLKRLAHEVKIKQSELDSKLRISHPELIKYFEKRSVHMVLESLFTRHFNITDGEYTNDIDIKKSELNEQIVQLNIQISDLEAELPQKTGSMLSSAETNEAYTLRKELLNQKISKLNGEIEKHKFEIDHLPNPIFVVNPIHISAMVKGIANYSLNNFKITLVVNPADYESRESINYIVIEFLYEEKYYYTKIMPAAFDLLAPIAMRFVFKEANTGSIDETIANHYIGDIRKVGFKNVNILGKISDKKERAVAMAFHKILDVHTQIDMAQTLDLDIKRLDTMEGVNKRAVIEAKNTYVTYIKNRELFYMDPIASAIEATMAIQRALDILADIERNAEWLSEFLTNTTSSLKKAAEDAQKAVTDALAGAGSILKLGPELLKKVSDAVTADALFQVVSLMVVHTSRIILDSSTVGVAGRFYMHTGGIIGYPVLSGIMGILPKAAGHSISPTIHYLITALAYMSFTGTLCSVSGVCKKRERVNTTRRRGITAGNPLGGNERRKTRKY
jgi:hypothetical protein